MTALLLGLCFLFVVAAGASPELPGAANLIYIKVPKTASSTSSGVLRNIGMRRGMSGVEQYAWDFRNEPGVSAGHIEMHTLAPRLRQLKRPLFLVTSLREPVERLISFFYYKGGKDPAGMPAVGNRTKNDMLDYTFDSGLLRARAGVDPTASKADLIVAGYDCFLIVERMTESLVALRHLLGLSFFDLIYLPAKNSSNLVIKPHGNSIRPHPTRAELPADVESYLANTFPVGNADYELYAKANRWLDRMIDAIGPSKFMMDVRELDALQASALEKCLKPQANDACIQRDFGCGIDCFAELERRSPIAKLPRPQAIWTPRTQ